MKLPKGLRVVVSLVLPLAAAFAFSVLYALYGLPMEAVLYGWILWISVSLVALGLGVLIHKLKVMELARQLEASKFSSYQSVPEATSEESRLFREHLVSLGMNVLQRENKDEESKQQRQDSIALWVHQIKTPISAMKLLLSGSEEKQLSSQLGVELYKIEQYVEMALHIDRLEAPTNDLVIVPVDLKLVVTGVIKKLRTLFIGKGLGIELELPEGIPKVISDEKWVAVAIEQIVTNAIKYTATGSISIALSGPIENVLLPSCVQHWNRGISLSIVDTGIGIASEDLPRVFEKGFTGYHGRYDNRATGIGLYLTKRALDLVGAYITMDSQLNMGTKVTIWFPVE